MDAAVRSRTLPHVCLFVTAAALLATAELAPTQFARLMQEDGWAEWATFATFVAAGVVALRALRPMRSSRLEALALLGLGVFALFVAGEEISWGQRLLGFRPPDVFLEHNHQQESNLHNLLKSIAETRWVVFALAVSYGVIAAYVAHVTTRLPRALAPASAWLPWYALVAWLEFSYPYELSGELAELLLGLVLLGDVVERSLRPSDIRAHSGDADLDDPRDGPVMARGARQIALAQLLVLAVAMPLVPLNDLLLRGRSGEQAKLARADLQQLASRVAQGAARDSLFSKREVHKRLYTAVRAGYLELEPGRYFLDPWHSPYWIAFTRTGQGRGRALLYSFGPNRRRDLDPAHARADRAGVDDLAIALELTAPAHAAR